MSDLITISTNPLVLKNNGVKIQVHKLQQNGEGSWARVRGEEGEFVYEDVFVRVTNWTLVQLEQDPPRGFGGLDLIDEALGSKSYTSLVRLYAAVFEYTLPNMDFDLQRVSMRLVDDGAADYMAAFSAIIQIAQGVDPKAVSEAATKALREAKQKQAEEHAKSLATQTDQTTQNSPTSDGSNPGSSSDEATTSSGD